MPRRAANAEVNLFNAFGMSFQQIGNADNDDKAFEHLQALKEAMVKFHSF